MTMVKGTSAAAKIASAFPEVSVLSLRSIRFIGQPPVGRR